MEIIGRFEHAANKIRPTIIRWDSTPQCPKYVASSPSPSKLRLCVLLRDHSQCRNCHLPGDEVTLEVRPIRPGASGIEEMLTLCVRCRSLVDDSNITGSNVFEFLQNLCPDQDPAMPVPPTITLSNHWIGA